MKLLILIFSLFYISTSLADVEIKWGNGKLSLKDLSGDEKLSEELQILQTEILIKEELSQKILSSSQKKQIIKFNLKSESVGDLKSKISKKILSDKVSMSIKDKKNLKIDMSDDEKDTSEIEIIETKGFVVVNKNDNYEVAEGEIVDTLVVTGGNVKINGEVGTLVLIKGTVNVGPNGKITKKVSELSGTVNVDQGGFVTGNKTGILDNFNFSGDLGRLFSFSGLQTKLFFAFVRFVQVLFLFWLGFRVIPYVREDLFNRKENWAYEGFIGLIHFCLMPFLIFVLTVTLVGISIIPIYSFLFYILGLLGYGLVSAYLGRVVVSKVRGESQTVSKYLYLVIGFLIFEILMLTPVIGWFVFMGLILVSVGYFTNLIIKQKA